MVSQPTIKGQVSNVLAKFGVTSYTEAVTFTEKHMLVG